MHSRSYLFLYLHFVQTVMLIQNSIFNFRNSKKFNCYQYCLSSVPNYSPPSSAGVFHSETKMTKRLF